MIGIPDLENFIKNNPLEKLILLLHYQSLKLLIGLVQIFISRKIYDLQTEIYISYNEHKATETVSNTIVGILLMMLNRNKK